MGMREIGSLTLPAGEEVSLEPGGYHIMLIDLAKPIEEGDTVPVTLTFEKAGEIEVEAEARES
jgi:copper(I)-binding protein